MKPRRSSLALSMQFQAPLHDPPNKRSPGAGGTGALSISGDRPDHTRPFGKTQMPKARTAERKARRAEAQRIIRHLGDLVVHHRVNDRKGSHITLWLSERRRVEWWPGTCRWHDPKAGTMRGSAAELVEFLRQQQPKRRAAA